MNDLRNAYDGNASTRSSISVTRFSDEKESHSRETQPPSSCVVRTFFSTWTYEDMW